MDERGTCRRRGSWRRRRSRRRNSDLDTQAKILVQLVSSYCMHNIGKCIHLGTYVDNY
jgi:hypothetical protein